MKILHIITNTELGGAQKVCADLCACAVKDGHTSAVASMAGGWLWQSLNPDVLQFYIPHMVKPLSLKNDIAVFFELRSVIKKINPDIIHLHSSKAGMLGRLAGFSRRSHIVYTVHGFDTIRIAHRKFLLLEKFFARLTGAVVPVSEYDRKNLEAEGIKGRFTTIKNGAAFRLGSAPDHAISEKLEQLRSTDPLIMTIARIASPKRFDVFLQTARNPSLAHCRFVWIGGSPDKSIEQISREYDIPDNVLLLGDVPDAGMYLQYCTLFILLSNYEGLPITIIEALAAGKPVIASNVGGIHELVDETNGVLLPPTADVSSAADEAAQAVLSVLYSSSLIEKMSAASSQRYLNGYTVEAMWKKYSDLYEQLTSSQEEKDIR